MTRVAPLAVAAGAVAACVAVSAPSGPARAAVTLAFLAAGPGLAFVPLLRLDGVLAPAVAIVATSVVVDGAVAETLVLTRAWSAPLALAILVALALAGAAAQLVLARREAVP